MVLLRKVNNADAGTADTLGGNDTDKIADYFNDVDVSETPRINTPTEYRSGILKLRDGSNAYSISLKSATQTNARDFTIPALIGNDSPATLALSNIFTAMQQVQLDADMLVQLYRPVSTTNALTGLGFYARNSSNAAVQYAGITNKLITNTAGAEDGKLLFYVRKAGVLTEVGSIDEDGLLSTTGLSVTTFSPASITTGAITGTTIDGTALTGTSLDLGTAKVGGVLLNTGATVTTASSNSEFDMLNYTVPANKLGVNGCLKVRVSGYLLQNQATGTDYTLKIKFGTTIIYADTKLAVAQSAVNMPFVIEFVFGNLNATNSQGATGTIMMNDVDVATTGEGDAWNDDEQRATGAFRTTDPAKDTTSNQVLQVTMTMSVNSASVKTVIQRRIIEFLPGA